jgi:hypothetical protein
MTSRNRLYSWRGEEFSRGSLCLVLGIVAAFRRICLSHQELQAINDRSCKNSKGCSYNFLPKTEARQTISSALVSNHCGTIFGVPPHTVDLVVDFITARVDYSTVSFVDHLLSDRDVLRASGCHGWRILLMSSAVVEIV